MTEPHYSRESEEVVEDATRRMAERWRADLKEHPSVDQLLDYQEGRLQAEEVTNLQRHLVLCRDCANDVLGLERWDQEAPSGPVPFLDREFLGVRRLQLEGKMVADTDAIAGSMEPNQVLRSSRASHSPGGGFRALAAALAVVSVAVGYWAGSADFGSSRPSESLSASSPFAIDLIPDGLRHRRSEQVRRVEVPFGMGPLVVRLNLGNASPFKNYRAELVDAEGRKLWSRDGLRRQPDGSFVLLVEERNVDFGEHAFRLLGHAGGIWAPLAEYSFSLDFSSEE